MPVPSHSHGRLVRVALVGAMVSAVVATAAGATAPTTITFAEHPAGTVIDAEYAAQGVRFGRASELGAPALAGAWDCGAPQVKEPTSDGPPPRLAQAPVCGGRSGTVAAFAHARKSLRLVVEATPSTDRQADVLAYGANGALLTSVRVSTNRSTATIERPSPDVAYLALQLTGEGTSALLFDDLSFDHLGDPLTLAPRGIGATVGVERTDNVARLTDADPTATAADYTVTIDWGDGQSSPGRVVASGDGYDVVGTHSYAATGTFTVRTTVAKVNGVRATTTSTARVVDRPDVAVAVTPTSATVSQGADGRFTVSVTPLAGFSGTVSLSLSGASGSFAPATVGVPGTSQLTVRTSAETAPASYPLTITAASGSASRTASAVLTVTKAAPTVVAKLVLPKPQPALSLVALDARTTTGASTYRWDVTGDGRDDITCGGTTPVLGLRSHTLGRRSIRLTAVGANGSTSVVRSPFGVRPRPGLSRAGASRSPEVAMCLRDATSFRKGRTCAKKVVFGVVEATGCFLYAETRGDVPAPERAAYDEYYARRGVSAAAQKRCESGAGCPDPLGAPGQLDPLVARRAIKLNGITFAPRGTAAIVLFPQIHSIVSSNAEVRLGKISVRPAGPVYLPLATRTLGKRKLDPPPQLRTLGKRGSKVKLLEFWSAAELPELGGFRLGGAAELWLVRRGNRYLSETTVRLALPAVFSLFGEAPSGVTRFDADNDRGLVLDELTVRVPEAHLGAIRMTDILFEYKAKGNPAFNCDRRWWKATANVFLGSAGGGAFRLAPDPPLNGIAFCNGSFRSAGGEIQFGAAIPPPQLFPGVYLTKIGFGIELEPTLLIGTATVSSGSLVDVSGRLLMAFPSWQAPYVVRSGDVGQELKTLVGHVFVSPTVAIGGTFKLRVPVLDEPIPLAGAHVAYSYPDFVSFGGSVRIPAPGLAINAGINGQMLVGRGLFDTYGYAEACIAGLACVLRAEAWVTSTGVVACLTIADELHPGAGYRWGDAWPTIWLVDGCKPSRYWVKVRPSALTLSPFGAAATTTFTVARGERTKNVRLEGVGGAPRIEVRGPGGELVTSAAGDFARGRTIRLLRQDGGRVTWIGVENALPGLYTVTTLPGSVPLGELAATRPQDDHIRATVVRKDGARVLRYDVARVPGRQVTFLERGRTTFRRLGSTAGGRGTLRIAVDRGTPGMRRIVAQVRLDGIPVPDRVVARYRAERPPRAGRPIGLAVRRRGAAVVASWRPAANAAGYVLVLRQRSGAVRVVRLPGARRSVRLAAIPATQPGAVTVRGLDGVGARGPAATARFPALRPAPSAFRPFSELRRRSPRR